MSEKQFKLNEKGSFILEDGEPLKPLGNVVHKLNEQQTTIEELKKQRVTLYGDISRQYEELEELRNENERQQATITHLEKVYGENFAKRRLLEQDNLILRNENEQLRKLLREAEDEIETLKESNKGLMESLVNKESSDEDDIYVPSKSSMRFL